MDLKSIFAATYLQQYWAVQIAIFVILFIYSASTGAVWDKSQGHRKPEDRIGWFEFRKRKKAIFTLAFIWMIYLCWTVIGAYCSGTESNTRVQQLLDAVTQPKNNSSDVTCTVLALVIFTLHIVRRLYECLRVSIFSRNQVFGPVRFIRDYVYHIAAGLTIIAESPSLVQQSSCFSLSELRWFHIVAIALFWWASKVHHNTHKQFAQLRRNRSGHIVTTGYKVPKDGWFDHLNVSCPHYFAEILIYVALGLVLGAHNCTWWLLTAYVTLNQIYHAYNTQRFYRSKFDDYPKNRKIILPFIF